MIRYHAEWVVPVSAPVIRDGTVVVHDGRIAWVGPWRDAPAGADVDLGRAVLTPGLVNAHCHLELTGMRGFLEGLAFREWIVRLTTAKRTVLSREDLLDAARLGVAEGLLAGVTTYADTCDSGVAFDAMLEAGVRGIMYQEVFGPDPAQRAASMDELRTKVDALRQRETPLVRVGISPHAPYTVSDALFAAVAAYAREAGLRVAVHVAESETESELVEQGTGPFAEGLRRRGISVAPRGRSPIELVARAGLVCENTLLIHAVRADAADVALVREGGAAIAHCPVSNAKLGHGIAPVRDYLRAGIRVGLGSDSVASNNRMDLLDEARVAALMASVAGRRADAISAEAAFELATLGGARALGLDDVVGSLEPGKRADLAAFAIGPGPGDPIQDPVTALVHSLSGASARFVAVDGTVLVRDGVLTHSASAVAGRVCAAAERLRTWLAGVQARGGVVPPPSATR